MEVIYYLMVIVVVVGLVTSIHLKSVPGVFVGLLFLAFVIIGKDAITGKSTPVSGAVLVGSELCKEDDDILAAAKGFAAIVTLVITSFILVWGFSRLRSLSGGGNSSEESSR